MSRTTPNRAGSLAPGAIIEPRTLTTITGEEVAVPAAEALVHLQFRRYAGCPICHLHLRQVAGRHGEIADAGIREVVVFHSAAPELRKYLDEFPFDVIADPDRALYREFGVEPSLRAVLHPRAVGKAIRGLGQGASVRGALGMGEGHFGRPADLLVAPSGLIVAAKYGTHADDQWSVDDLLALASAH
ncbi:peroxiredoxin-like family protein [Nocardioides limicola]|uniref:peroxiredoxin-like family protein n=1 Tax=Nocardioides limicola TaxID=2803368 RepID=UPI00193BF13D|nr:peroxiredoxin-like family protein [Nocardioides sp. DJM-14]